MATARIARRAVLSALCAAAAACGQRGPLTLPPDAQPVERLDPAASGSRPDGAAEPADAAQDDAAQDDERDENER